MFDVVAFFRFFVAGIAGALTAYVVSLTLLARVAGLRRGRRPAAFGHEVRRGRHGYARLYAAWVVAFTVYGLIATYDAMPFTYAWLHCAIFDGDWVVILAAPLVFAYFEWHRANRPSSLPSRKRLFSSAAGSGQ